MTLFLQRFTLFVALLSGLPAVFGADAAPAPADLARRAAVLPASAFFGHPGVRLPQLSPDGTKIAFLFPFEGRMALGLFDCQTKEARMILRGRDESLLSFFWKGNERIVFYADYQGNESTFVASTDLTGKKVTRIVETQPGEYLQGSAGGILDSLRADTDRIVVAGIFRPSYWFDSSSTTADFVVTRVNVRNRGLSIAYTYHAVDRTRSVHVDNTGAVRLRSREVNGLLVWEHRANDDAPWREISRHPIHGYAETWEPQFFAADNRTLWLISREEHDRGALYAYDTATGVRGDTLFVPLEGEITSLVTSHDRSKLQGVAYEAARRCYHWFDAGRGKLQASLEATFPGLDVTVASKSADEQVCLVHIGSDREAGVYYVLDRKAGSLTQFKRVRELDSRLLRPMTPVTFAARDGLELHGYLTLPFAAEGGRKVPLIIHPHGGPFGVRDEWSFNPDVQFLASRGYAVLQVNYRGSGGYGREFISKGRRQWGRAMQDDLTDAVHWAIAQGYADPERVAIYGASYGGYAVLAGLVFTPELYRCGVNYVGVADLTIGFKRRGEDAYRHGSDFSYQREWIGAANDYVNETSPVNFVERIRVPSLHAYGRKDPRVEFDHWTRLESALKKHRKPYVAIEQKRQGHGFRDEKASLEFYAAMEKFLAENLAPGTP